MSKYNYTDFEKQLNTVLAHQSSELSSINFPNADSLDESITSSEELLKKLGYKVVRFTGSQIYKHPLSCVDILITIILNDINGE